MELRTTNDWARTLESPLESIHTFCAFEGAKVLDVQGCNKRKVQKKVQKCFAEIQPLLGTDKH